jgi:hypothetical protein
MPPSGPDWWLPNQVNELGSRTEKGKAQLQQTRSRPKGSEPPQTPVLRLASSPPSTTICGCSKKSVLQIWKARKVTTRDKSKPDMKVCGPDTNRTASTGGPPRTDSSRVVGKGISTGTAVDRKTLRRLSQPNRVARSPATRAGARHCVGAATSWTPGPLRGTARRKASWSGCKVTCPAPNGRVWTGDTHLEATPSPIARCGGLVRK